MTELIQYGLISFFAISILLSMWNDRKEQKLMAKNLELKKASTKQQAQDARTTNVTLKTRDLFLDILTKIGCQYKLGEGDDTRIFFAYQGEHFFGDTTNDIMYVHIWDTHWGHVELYDIDEVARLRRAINTSNLNTSVTTVFTIDEDGKNMDVHSKAVIPFISTMPNLEDYLKVELNEFFHSHQVVGNEMQKLREAEKQEA